MDFDGAVALGPYTDRLRDLVLAMKSPSQTELARFFAGRLADRASTLPVTLVTAVPMTRLDFIWRGYNHAGHLAEHVARLLNRPYEEHALRKIRATRKQKELPLPVRMRNPAAAFQAGDPDRIRGQSILLVDDVLTTGATLSACAAPLRRAGAAAVWAAVVTRG